MINDHNAIDMRETICPPKIGVFINTINSIKKWPEEKLKKCAIFRRSENLLSKVKNILHHGIYSLKNLELQVKHFQCFQVTKINRFLPVIIKTLSYDSH